MKIEVGKTYIDNDGDKVEIIRKLNDGIFVGVGTVLSGHSKGTEYVAEFTEDGEESSDYSRYTLVREYFGPATKKMFATVDEKSNLICNIYHSMPTSFGSNCRVTQVQVTEIEE